MKTVRTWMLIADAGVARIYESVPGARHLSEHADLKLSEDVPPGRALADDRPGRSNPGVGASRLGLQPTSDPRREMKRQFAEEVADMLDREAERVRERITLELDKDLTKTPHAELEAYLEAALKP